MARRRLKLAFITNQAARKATYNKRLKGLKKKVSDVTILCDVVACAIVFNPFNFEPEVWPNELGVQQVIDRFQSLSVMEQEKKMLNQETIVGKWISKLRKQLENQRQENRKKEMNELMNQTLADMGLLQNLMPQDMEDLMGIIDQRLKEVTSRMEAMKKGASDQDQVASAPELSEMLPSVGTQGGGQS